MLSKWRSASNGIAIPLVNYSNGEASAVPKPCYSVSPTKEVPPSTPTEEDTEGTFDTPEDEQILKPQTSIPSSTQPPLLTTANVEKHEWIERKERKHKDRRKERRRDENYKPSVSFAQSSVNQVQGSGDVNKHLQTFMDLQDQKQDSWDLGDQLQESKHLRDQDSRGLRDRLCESKDLIDPLKESWQPMDKLKDSRDYKENTQEPSVQKDKLQDTRYLNDQMQTSFIRDQLRRARIQSDQMHESNDIREELQRSRCDQLQRSMVLREQLQESGDIQDQLQLSRDLRQQLQQSRIQESRDDQLQQSRIHNDQLQMSRDHSHQLQESRGDQLQNSRGQKQLQALKQLCQYLEMGDDQEESKEGESEMGSLKASPRHNRISGDFELIRRVKKKFESLEQTSMERYQAREQKVVTTLDFCMTALEQLRSWAVFAIFPTDEDQKDKYVQFVEQRYSCVIDPLRLFLNAIERCNVNGGANDVNSTSNAQSHRTSPRRQIESERGRQPIKSTSSQVRHQQQQRSLSTSGRYSGLGDISIQRGNRFKNTPESPRLGHPITPPPPLDLQGLNDEDDVIGENDDTENDVTNMKTSQQPAEIVSLRDYINRISREHSEEGSAIKEAVTDKLRRCRKDSKTLYKWGQASLLDLQEVLDETLADELYFMVRSKMARILSTISIFEETAEQIERSLSNHFQNKPNIGSVSERGTSSTGKLVTAKKKPAVVPPGVLVRENSSADLRGSSESFASTDRSAKSSAAERLGPSDGASNPSNSGRFEDLSDLDLRIEIPSRDSPTGSEGNELEDLLLTWSFNGGNVGHVRLGSGEAGGVLGLTGEKHSEASTPRSSSTPEPPVSPRPRALVKHPKIMKDKLHSMALPSKFPGFSPGRASATW